MQCKSKFFKICLMVVMLGFLVVPDISQGRINEQAIIWNNSSGHSHDGASKGKKITVLDLNDVIHKDVRNYSSLADAISSIGATKTTLNIGVDTTVATSIIIPSTLTLNFISPGKLVKSASGTVTFNGEILSPYYQIFSGFASGDISFGSSQEVFAEWWGVDGTADNVEIQLALDSGAYIVKLLPNKIYGEMNGTITIDTDNQSLIGSRVTTVLKATEGFGSSGEALIQVGDAIERKGCRIGPFKVDISNAHDNCVGVYKKTCQHFVEDNVWVRGNNAATTAQVGHRYGNGTHGRIIRPRSEVVKICYLFDNLVSNEMHGTTIYELKAIPKNVSGAICLHFVGGYTAIVLIQPYLETGISSGSLIKGIVTSAGSFPLQMYSPRFDGDFLAAYDLSSANPRWSFIGAGNEKYEFSKTLAFTSGGTTTVSVGNLIIGATSGALGYIDVVEIDSGSWAGGDAVGTFHVISVSGAFQAENLDTEDNTNVATISGDLVSRTDVLGSAKFTIFGKQMTQMTERFVVMNSGGNPSLIYDAAGLGVGQGSGRISVIRPKSVTWNPANIVNGGDETKIVNIPSIEPGDPMFVGFSSIDALSNPNLWTIRAYVKSNGVVHVRITNNTGGDVNLASGVLNIVVFRLNAYDPS